MPDPVETISLLTELTIGLAGFSGIVTALNARDSKLLASLDRRRLENLLTHAMAVLASGLLALLLLHASLPATSVWRIVGAAWAVGACLYVARDLRRVRDLAPVDRRLINRSLLAVGHGGLAAAAVLQLGNVIAIQEFWPVLIALSLNLLLGFADFVLLLSSEVRPA